MLLLKSAKSNYTGQHEPSSSTRPVGGCIPLIQLHSLSSSSRCTARARYQVNILVEPRWLPLCCACCSAKGRSATSFFCLHSLYQRQQLQQRRQQQRCQLLLYFKGARQDGSRVPAVS